YGIAVDAEPKALALRQGRRLRALALGHGRHVFGVVKARELRGRRERRIDIAPVREPAERAAEIHRQRDARDGERVLSAVARMAVDLTADEAGAGHAGFL